MATADAEICRPWRYHRFGVYGEKEFARVNPRLECRPVFNHIYKHPTLAFWSVDRTQRGVDGIRRRDAVAALVKKGCVATAQRSEKFTHPRFKRFCAIHINEMRHAFANERNPWPIVLIRFADIDVSFGNELLEDAEDLRPVLLRERSRRLGVLSEWHLSLPYFVVVSLLELKFMGWSPT